MKKIIGFFSKNRIRRKLILYSIVTTMIMGVGLFFTYNNARMLATGMDAIFSNNKYLSELNNSVTNLHSILENFLSTNHSDSLKDYYKFSGELRMTGEAMSQRRDLAESGLLLKDIGNMIITYLDSADAAVSAKRGRDIESYISHYTDASETFEYITTNINKLTLNQFDENTRGYTMISGRVNLIQALNLIIIIGIIVFNTIFIIRMTFKITEPIISLSKAANQISKGNLEIKQVTVHSDDEIGIMADAFNRMADSIKEQMNAIKEGAELEARFKEQEMQYLLMKNHLRETELHALQSQINPHFIFNTLNAGAQLAMFEEADQTYHYIQCFSNLFRYNLRSLDTPVTLKDEIENIDNYITLLKVRYTDRITYRNEVDERVTNVLMPCMILQPLIENAFIHGISSLESGGIIILRVKGIDGDVVIEVEDNGVGMDREKIRQLLDDTDDDPSDKDTPTGHTTGIGTKNVIQRLHNYFNTQDMVRITSKQPGGTKVSIIIPEEKTTVKVEVLHA
ncbi:MAG: sensor histidine kinase [Clostridiaceae bacterium]|nr:sensor histidine kinase [Clostridiaceae bacterium]